MKKIILFIISFLAGCTGIPEGITPVNDFKLDNYLGKWYEIARLDHSFERGLSNVTAQYSLRDDGNITVVNRGYSTKTNKWKEAEGRAKFVESKDLGYLKVSFFGPFYGSYIVFELDKKNYQYALVSGPDKSYLWILSRTPSLDKSTTNYLVNKAKISGFDTNQLIFVSHKQLN